MQKWEYATLNRQRMLNKITLQIGVEAPEKVGEPSDIWYELTKLGNEGWELAVVLPGPVERPDDCTMVFKRPKG